MKNPRQFIIVFLLFIPLFASADDKELKKLAHNLYISEQYAEAAKLFYQLIQMDTANRMNHYFYGVSLLQSGGSRTEAIKFLESALADQGVPAMAHYHLAKAYQLNHRFDKAIECYERFKISANPIYVEELKVDEQIAMCARAKTSIENKNEIILEHKQEATLAHFAITYNEQSAKSRLLAVPDRIRKGRNKEKFSTFLFVDENGKWMSYSAPGKNSGKEIFIATRKNSNEWHEAVPVKFERPFPFASENPVITENGTHLHFSCNSFNSIGGYDVYESKLNMMSGIWSYPEPLPIPVNSPADEMIFIPLPKEKKAALLSNRNSAVNQSGVFYMQYPFPKEILPVHAAPAMATKQEMQTPRQENEITATSEVLKPKASVEIKPVEETKIASRPDALSRPEPNQSAKKTKEPDKETKITLIGFFYDASRMNHTGYPELAVKTKQGVYRSTVQYPSGEFTLTVPANQQYEISLEGNISTAPVEITLRESKDSCTIVLITRKTENGYALAVVQEHEKMNDQQYAIQLGAFREKPEAEILSYYRSKGIRKAEVIARQDLKLVVAGKDLTLSEALKERKQFLQSGFNDAFIVMRKGNEILAPDWDLAMLR